jgi:NADPH:quinone reductase-like Zn-dependent oxidoreductase
MGRRGRKVSSNESHPLGSVRGADIGSLVEDVPVPEAGEGEAKIRIVETPVNPSDLLYARGHYAGSSA